MTSDTFWTVFDFRTTLCSGLCFLSNTCNKSTVLGKTKIFAKVRIPCFQRHLSAVFFMNCCSEWASGLEEGKSWATFLLRHASGWIPVALGEIMWEAYHLHVGCLDVLIYPLVEGECWLRPGSPTFLGFWILTPLEFWHWVVRANTKWLLQEGEPAKKCQGVESCLTVLRSL